MGVTAFVPMGAVFDDPGGRSDRDERRRDD